MHCPHCQVTFDADRERSDTDFRNVDRGPEKLVYSVRSWACPTCKALTIDLVTKVMMFEAGGSFVGNRETASTRVYPKGSGRLPAPSEVPDSLRRDYDEACVILNDSPKAAAALGRRSLQMLLNDHLGATKRDLVDAIDEVLATKTLPSHLGDAIDAVRHIGNFAAHPIKSKSSGEIVEVEPGEAEWTLETVAQLFDFVFVAPAQLRAKRAALDAKLADTGKPPLKGT